MKSKYTATLSQTPGSHLGVTDGELGALGAGTIMPPCGLSWLSQTGTWFERSLPLVVHLGAWKHFSQKSAGLIWPKEGVETAATAPKDLKGPRCPRNSLPDLMTEDNECQREEGFAWGPPPTHPSTYWDPGSLLCPFTGGPGQLRLISPSPPCDLKGVGREIPGRIGTEIRRVKLLE